MWYVINNTDESDLDGLTLNIQVPPESNWFSGHFPGEPILPGIAQLGMVFDAITRAAGRNFKITGIRRVRFKQIIRPDDPVCLKIKPQKNGSGAYDFRIQVHEELACSGVMTVAVLPEKS